MAQLPKCLGGGGGLNIAHRCSHLDNQPPTRTPDGSLTFDGSPASRLLHPHPIRAPKTLRPRQPTTRLHSTYMWDANVACRAHPSTPRASGPMRADAHEQACNHNNKDNIAYAHHPTTQPAWALAPRPKPEWSHSLDGCKSDTANDAATSHRRRKLLTKPAATAPTANRTPHLHTTTAQLHDSSNVIHAAKPAPRTANDTM
ncbi:hypothetical protein BU15DRAFT_69319 [Melanogaster broomeanus]|nr:hypothetical protein BU15DRAFT_69319 [Melanogaster broomeanus]